MTGWGLWSRRPGVRVPSITLVPQPATGPVPRSRPRGSLRVAPAPGTNEPSPPSGHHCWRSSSPRTAERSASRVDPRASTSSLIAWGPWPGRPTSVCVRRSVGFVSVSTRSSASAARGVGARDRPPGHARSPPGRRCQGPVRRRAAGGRSTSGERRAGWIGAALAVPPASTRRRRTSRSRAWRQRQIDPEGGEQLAVAGLRAWQHTLGDQAVDLGPDGREIEAVGAKHAGRRVVAVEEQAEEHVLGPQVAMVQPPSLLMGHAGRDTSRLGDIHRSGDFHHRGYLRDPGRLPGPCFWWTACLLTPSRLAMSCQDQPLVRALSTCRASRTSSSPRREATARRPISGSWLLLATAKVATSRSARFSMPSRYLDDSKAVNPFLTMELSGSQPGDLLPRLALPSGSRADPTGGRPGQWSSCRCCRPAPGCPVLVTSQRVL